MSTPAWMAAPSATTSSGLTVMFGSLPPVSRRTRACTAGMRVDPPTRMTSSMSFAVTLASAIACLTGPMQRSTRSWVSSSNFDRSMVIVRCLGPLASAVTNGRLTCVWVTDYNSTLAFSAASNSRCSACGSVRRSMPCLALELLGQIVDEPPVEVVATQMGIAGGGTHLDHTVTDVEEADVERAAAEVEDQHRLVAASCPARRPAPRRWAR